MLMAISIAPLAASAQSAQRGTPHNSQGKKSSSAVTSNSQRNAANKSTARSTSKSVQSRNVSQNNAANRSVSQKPDNRSVQKNRASSGNAMANNATRKNSGNNYSAASRTATGKTYKDPKAGTGNAVQRPSHSAASHVNMGVTRENHRFEHFYYPDKKVKIHVHPATYHNHYKVMYYPAYREIIWTNRMYRFYADMYPGYAWRYPVGYRIQTISAFEARYNIGEVARIYGRVYATWYNRESDDLLLFFGGEFPHQEFTMIIPGNIARRYSWRPEKYFLGQHVLATGLITSYDGSPEMIIKKKHQLDVY